MKKTEDLKFGDPCEVRDYNKEDWEPAIFGCDFSKIEGFTDNYIYSVMRNDQIQVYKKCRPIQETREFWVNVLKEASYGNLHESKELADAVASGRKECLHLIDYNAVEQLQEENKKLQKELEAERSKIKLTAI